VLFIKGIMRILLLKKEVLKSGANGNFSGKAGSVVGYVLNGQGIIRGMPRRKKKKPTAKEQANRDKFAMLQFWLQPLLHYLRIGFKDYAPTFQGFVAAKSYNNKYALQQREEGCFFVNPALALISHGALPLPEALQMEE